MNIPVIFEDQWLMVVDKPAGLLVIPTPKKEVRTLTNILNQDAELKNAPYRFHPCHRLDRETSGLLIYAKGKSSQKKIMDLFHQRAISKTYIALVRGVLLKSKGEIKNRIEGKSALTRYRVVRQGDDFSEIQAQPLTGRTNQIRIHFRQLNHPIIGERRFAYRKDFKIKSKHLCLHARRLEFIHPLTKRKISISAPLPPHMKKLIEL